nr:hypothetical protein [Pseudoclavibacter sp. Marseille-Q3772]
MPQPHDDEAREQSAHGTGGWIRATFRAATGSAAWRIDAPPAGIDFSKAPRVKRVGVPEPAGDRESEVGDRTPEPGDRKPGGAPSGTRLA